MANSTIPSIIYISGDNGASAEGCSIGTPNDPTAFNGVEVPVKDQLPMVLISGAPTAPFPHFRAPWAWAFDTPFKWTKQVASHFGGTAQGVAMSWPGHINDAGGIRRQFHHTDRYRAYDPGSDGISAAARSTASSSAPWTA